MLRVQFANVYKKVFRRTPPELPSEEQRKKEKGKKTEREKGREKESFPCSTDLMPGSRQRMNFCPPTPLNAVIFINA